MMGAVTKLIVLNGNSRRKSRLKSFVSEYIMFRSPQRIDKYYFFFEAAASL